MTNVLYTPRTGTLPAFVSAYFRRLPEEELSCADIAIKWQTDPKNVAAQLQRAVDAGLLERDGSIYKAGPDIERFDLSLNQIASSSKTKTRNSRFVPSIDIEAIEFETGIEIPKSQSASLEERWKAKIQSMRSGQSFSVEMPHRYGINSAATALRKKGMDIKVLRETPDRIRVYCLKAMSEVRAAS